VIVKNSRIFDDPPVADETMIQGVITTGVGHKNLTEWHVGAVLYGDPWQGFDPDAEIEIEVRVLGAALEDT